MPPKPRSRSKKDSPPQEDIHPYTGDPIEQGDIQLRDDDTVMDHGSPNVQPSTTSRTDRDVDAYAANQDQAEEFVRQVDMQPTSGKTTSPTQNNDPGTSSMKKSRSKPSPDSQGNQAPQAKASGSPRGTTQPTDGDAKLDTPTKAASTKKSSPGPKQVPWTSPSERRTLRYGKLTNSQSPLVPKGGQKSTNAYPYPSVSDAIRDKGKAENNALEASQPPTLASRLTAAQSFVDALDQAEVTTVDSQEHPYVDNMEESNPYTKQPSDTEQVSQDPWWVKPTQWDGEGVPDNAHLCTDFIISAIHQAKAKSNQS
ncbi:MAG: hypothetical protein LC650_05765, partial [Actinobacteria bacterium]|nr:hypothetical protein [Actinomycetota bacterium]